jgi:hypothetical protein
MQTMIYVFYLYYTALRLSGSSFLWWHGLLIVSIFGMVYFVSLYQRTYWQKRVLVENRNRMIEVLYFNDFLSDWQQQQQDDQKDLSKKSLSHLSDDLSFFDEEEEEEDDDKIKEKQDHLDEQKQSANSPALEEEKEDAESNKNLSAAMSVRITPMDLSVMKGPTPTGIVKKMKWKRRKSQREMAVQLLYGSSSLPSFLLPSKKKLLISFNKRKEVTLFDQIPLEEFQSQMKEFSFFKPSVIKTIAVRPSSASSPSRQRPASPGILSPSLPMISSPPATNNLNAQEFIYLKPAPAPPVFDKSLERSSVLLRSSTTTEEEEEWKQSKYQRRLRSRHQGQIRKIVHEMDAKLTQERRDQRLYGDILGLVDGNSPGKKKDKDQQNQLDPVEIFIPPPETPLGGQQKDFSTFSSPAKTKESPTTNKIKSQSHSPGSLPHPLPLYKFQKYSGRLRKRQGKVNRHFSEETFFTGPGGQCAEEIRDSQERNHHSMALLHYEQETEDILYHFPNTFHENLDVIYSFSKKPILSILRSDDRIVFPSNSSASASSSVLLPPQTTMTMMVNGEEYSQEEEGGEGGEAETKSQIEPNATTFLPMETVNLPLYSYQQKIFRSEWVEEGPGSVLYPPSYLPAVTEPSMVLLSVEPSTMNNIIIPPSEQQQQSDRNPPPPHSSSKHY